MALEAKLKRGAIDADLAFFLVQDNTGNYDAVDNAGGYGTPNPDRVDLALYVYGYRYKKDSDDLLLLIDNSADATSVTSWQVPMTEDGYYWFRMLTFNVWNDATAFVANNLVYYAGAYYRALDASTNEIPSVYPLKWELLSDADLISDELFEDANVVSSTTLDTVINSRAKACYQIQVKKHAKENCSCKGDVPGPVVQPYMKIFVHLNAAAFDCRQQKYAQADAELMYLKDYCASIGCGC
jgi:hypothetical protein